MINDKPWSFITMHVWSHLIWESNTHSSTEETQTGLEKGKVKQWEKWEYLLKLGIFYFQIYYDIY